jgi:hypothetical protein
MTFSKLIIALEPEKSVYSPGDVVQGTVSVDVDKEVRLASFQIQLIGTAKSYW